MTRVLFLHAGPPKTGSTTIQLFFRDNAAVFARQGLYRPTTGTEHRSHYHFDLVSAFAPARDPDPLVARLKLELQSHGLPERVFLSAEHFAARLADPAYIAALTNFCAELGYRLHVIVHVRPQPALLNSLYTQNVKSWRPVAAMEQFAAREMQSGRHDYVRHFAALRANPDTTFTLLPFNRPALTRGLTAGMCEVMGLTTEGEDLASPEEANVSPGPRTVAAFQRLRRRITNEYPMLDRDALAVLTWPLLRAAGVLGWNDDKYGGITPDLLAAITSHFAASNEELSRSVWSMPWSGMFTQAESAPPPYNVFDPAAAAPSDRRALRDFVEQSMEAVSEIATLHQGQPRLK